MSADIAERLRSLARDYHDGRIDFAAYRSLRAPLLDSLALPGTSSPMLEVTQPRAPVWQSEAITRPGKPGFAATRSTTASGRHPALDVREAARRPGTLSRTLMRVSVVIAAMVLIAIAMVSLWQTSGDETSPSAAAHEDASAAQVAHLREELSAFSVHGDWSDARLATLNASLLEYGSQNIAVIARDAQFQRFVDELRRRLKEQQALAATALTVDNSPIAALAVTVGIDLNSPDSAIHIAALPPPPELTPIAISARPKAISKRVTTSESAPDVAGSLGATAAAKTMHSVVSSAAQPAPIVPLSQTPAASAGVSSTAREDTCRAELIGSRRPLCHDTLSNGVEAPTLALVPAGTFEMGSTAAAEEQPVHRGTIRAPFAISIYEVSQGEFKQFCEQTNRPCTQQPWTGDDYPVVNVSWDEARAYTDWLSNVTHRRYSLPTEAQWEYAARAGRTGLFPSGDALSPTDAHYTVLNKQTSAVRRRQKFNANAFRLVHTIGNVREWVEDAWSPTFISSPSTTLRVVRGGSYTDGASRLRLSMREGLAPSTRDTTTGFRIVRELP